VMLQPSASQRAVRYRMLFVPKTTGQPCSAVQWGAWGGVGMVAGSAAVLSRMERAGLGMLTPATGLAALAGVLHQRGAPALVKPP
jgi:hypothetical protein